MDMVELLDNEKVYGTDIFAEKQKYINALDKLAKQQLLYTEVIGFITRYLEQSEAFETIEAVIKELDYGQSTMIKNVDITLAQSAYV